MYAYQSACYIYIWKWTERHERFAKCLGKQVAATNESAVAVMGMVVVRVQGSNKHTRKN